MEGTRTCGLCDKAKPYSEFYSDGTDNYGKKRYRRDCKECYRVTRLKARRMKEAARIAAVEADAKARGAAKTTRRRRR